jgi:FkbM family methyltransferase
MPNFTEGLPRLEYLDVTEVPTVSVDTPFGKTAFHMYGEYTEFRVRTLLTKEPETVHWISEMRTGETLWDIGANIGIYSVLAGRRGVTVTAFEPSPTNFWLLNQNVSLNGLDAVRCLAFALSGSTGLVSFAVDLTPAAAGINQISSGTSRTIVQAYQADDLVASGAVGAPHHIKLDVDGIELDILRGASGLLSDQTVRSVMCEVDESDEVTTREIHSLLKSFGFSSVTTRFPPYLDDNYYLPRANHLFRRT